LPRGAVCFAFSTSAGHRIRRLYDAPALEESEKHGARRNAYSPAATATFIKKVIAKRRTANDTWNDTWETAQEPGSRLPGESGLS
jgi:hypothetical protein